MNFGGWLYFQSEAFGGTKPVLLVFRERTTHDNDIAVMLMESLDANADLSMAICLLT